MSHSVARLIYRFDVTMNEPLLHELTVITVLNFCIVLKKIVRPQ